MKQSISPDEAIGELVRLTSQQLTAEAVFIKKGHIIPNWKQRKFYLEQTLIEYYEETENEKMGEIDLKGATAQRLKRDPTTTTTATTDIEAAAADTTWTYPFSIKTKDGTVYEVRASTKSDCKRWVRIVESVGLVHRLLLGAARASDQGDVVAAFVRAANNGFPLSPFVDERRRNALHLAVLEGREDVVGALLSVAPGNNSSNNNELVRLATAVDEGEHEEDDNNRTPLCLAVKLRHTNLVDLFITKGALPSSLFDRAFLEACDSDASDSVALGIALKLSCRLSSINCHHPITGNTALHHAASHLNLGLIDIVLNTKKAAGSINLQNALGETPLSLATWATGDADTRNKIIERLKENGADALGDSSDTRSNWEALVDRSYQIVQGLANLSYSAFA